MLAALCDKEKIAYHLYTLCGGPPKADDAGIKLRRKTKWQSQNKYFKGDFALFFEIFKIFH